jgi:hypothetical protein
MAYKGACKPADDGACEQAEYPDCDCSNHDDLLCPIWSQKSGIVMLVTWGQPAAAKFS